MAEPRWLAALSEAWTAVSDAPLPNVPEVEGGFGLLPSRLPVLDTAIACVGTALVAASPHRPVRLATGHVAAAMRSEVHARRDGRPPPPPFDPLSRFWRASDGWVRTHANYPWHREALLRALGEPDDVETAIGRVRALDLEQQVVAAGGVTAAVRTPDEWLATAQGRAVAGGPLIGGVRLGDAPARHRVPGELPISGVRVLDLTRVIAGPVCTRFLAALGADVLRLDPPHRPELPGSHDALLGKHLDVLDARTSGGLERLHELLDEADVLVHGYRPGALDRFGLDAESLADRHPGLVVVSLSAWGTTGPWGGRRGFDSLVQAATGIAALESAEEAEPGALPCQLLDHGTGYLCAAAVLDGLRRQSGWGGTVVRWLSLARTAHWLLDRPGGLDQSGTSPPRTSDPGPWLTSVDGPDGRMTVVSPPGEVDGRALRWPERVGTA